MPEIGRLRHLSNTLTTWLERCGETTLEKVPSTVPDLCLIGGSYKNDDRGPRR